jgi:hypothetical protein
MQYDWTGVRTKRMRRLKQKSALSFEKAISIGLLSGEYRGRKSIHAFISAMAAAALGLTWGLLGQEPLMIDRGLNDAIFHSGNT